MNKLGLYLGRLPGWDKRGFNSQELIECVQTADGCGYDSIWLPEAWERDAFALLTQLALKTRRIALGTGIINVFSRSPAVIAMSAATLDEISEGRFRLGLGTSGAKVVENLHGVSFDKPLQRLRETISIVRTLLAGERLQFEGECFKVAGFKLGFTPVRPDIPIYIAALTPKSLQQLGEIADGWLPTYWPFDQLESGIREIGQGTAQTSRDIVSIDIAPFVNVVVSDNAAAARDSARLPLAYYIGGMGRFYFESLTRLGFAREAARIRELWEAGKPREAIKSVPDSMVDAVSICGSVGECRSRLADLYSKGATTVLVPIPSEGSTLEKCRLIEELKPT